MYRRLVGISPSQEMGLEDAMEYALSGADTPHQQ
jgi:hypothetical protein